MPRWNQDACIIGVVFIMLLNSVAAQDPPLNPEETYATCNSNADCSANEYEELVR